MDKFLGCLILVGVPIVIVNLIIFVPVLGWILAVITAILIILANTVWKDEPPSVSDWTNSDRYGHD
jgi:hypothetical protein